MVIGTVRRDELLNQLVSNLQMGGDYHTLYALATAWGIAEEFESRVGRVTQFVVVKQEGRTAGLLRG